MKIEKASYFQMEGELPFFATKYNYTLITRQRFYLCVSMPIPANATFCSFTIQRYGKVELIDTTNGIFMSLTEAK